MGKIVNMLTIYLMLLLVLMGQVDAKRGYGGLMRRSSTIIVVKLDDMIGDKASLAVASSGFKDNRLVIVKASEAKSDGFEWVLTGNTCGSKFELKKETSLVVRQGRRNENGQQLTGAPNIHRWF